jgi:hypothetical protein
MSLSSQVRKAVLKRGSIIYLQSQLLGSCRYEDYYSKPALGKAGKLLSQKQTKNKRARGRAQLVQC